MVLHVPVVASRVPVAEQLGNRDKAETAAEPLQEQGDRREHWLAIVLLHELGASRRPRRP
jgi:hypothetical protein